MPTDDIKDWLELARMDIEPNLRSFARDDLYAIGERIEALDQMVHGEVVRREEAED
jgi:hypothetical protein